MDDIEDNYKMIKLEKKTKSLDITKRKKKKEKHKFKLSFSNCEVINWNRNHGRKRWI